MPYVNAKLFEIAHRFASKGDSRYYLEGVHIEAAPEGGAFLVATDGHRMMVVHDSEASAPERPLIMQASALALKACKAKESARIIIGNGGGEIVTDEGQSLASGIAEIDGTFVDWRRVVPVALPEDGPSAPFRPSYVSDFAKAAIDLGKLNGWRTGMVSMRQEGPRDVAVILFGDAPAFGLLMPTRAADLNTDASAAAYRLVRTTARPVMVAAE
jgi:hypothetical protein